MKKNSSWKRSNSKGRTVSKNGISNDEVKISMEDQFQTYETIIEKPNQLLQNMNLLI